MVGQDVILRYRFYRYHRANARFCCVQKRKTAATSYPKCMATGATPRQGDHVFNDLSLALLRPFDIIQSLTSAHVDGRHFIHDYLLHAYSLAKTMADAPPLSQARTLAAFAGDEQNALREIAALRPRNLRSPASHRHSSEPFMSRIQATSEPQVVVTTSNSSAPYSKR
jgi:hypothetical protein